MERFYPLIGLRTREPSHPNERIFAQYSERTHFVKKTERVRSSSTLSLPVTCFLPAPSFSPRSSAPRDGPKLRHQQAGGGESADATSIWVAARRIRLRQTNLGGGVAQRIMQRHDESGGAAGAQRCGGSSVAWSRRWCDRAYNSAPWDSVEPVPAAGSSAARQTRGTRVGSRHASGVMRGVVG